MLYRLQFNCVTSLDSPESRVVPQNKFRSSGTKKTIPHSNTNSFYYDDPSEIVMRKSVG